MRAWAFSIFTEAYCVNNEIFLFFPFYNKVYVLDENGDIIRKISLKGISKGWKKYAVDSKGNIYLYLFKPVKKKRYKNIIEIYKFKGKEMKK